jgi:hypothetical protein
MSKIVNGIEQSRSCERGYLLFAGQILVAVSEGLVRARTVKLQ